MGLFIAKFCGEIKNLFRHDLPLLCEIFHPHSIATFSAALYVKAILVINIAL